MQRRTEASRSAADKERPSSQEDHELRRGDEQDDDDTGDSKETRLTLMEEVLLLGLKDREVSGRILISKITLQRESPIKCCEVTQVILANVDSTG